MDNFFNRFKSNKFVFFIAVIATVLLVFGAGISVGYRRALFASEWGRNYYNNFYGGERRPIPMMGFPDRGFMGMHGTVGTIIDISSSTISIKGRDNTEKSVAVDGDEVIRRGVENITLSSLRLGDSIAVIGGPNASGQVEARFIRVFPARGSSPSPKN